MEELINTSQLDVVGRLAFKYMEMCKVDSSSDTESETNPRRSDVIKTCESAGPENPGTAKKLQLLRQNYQQVSSTFDPYDGSSEDSGSSDKGWRKQRQAGVRMKTTGRRSALTSPSAVDVQMKSSSDSELETGGQDFCSLRRTTSRAEGDLWDSGFNTRSSVSSPACRDAGPPSALSRCGSPGPESPVAFSKRKFLPPSGEVDDGMRRKRQCVSDMEA